MDSDDVKKVDNSGGGGGVRQTLLIVFIHGFKGSDKSTFADFPERVAHMVGQTYPTLQVNPIIYPTYETRGSLSKAVEGFVDWLTTKTVEIECEPPKPDDPFSEPGGAGSVKIVLCGHSMGGLVAVDAALEIAKSAQGTASGKLWPRVCGVLAFDTPYYGVHPSVFKNTANKMHGYYQSAQKLSAQLAPVGTALATWWGTSAAAASNAQQGSNNNSTRQVGSSSQKAKKSSSFWSTALIATSAVALAGGAAAGTLYGGGWTYLNDHFLYVSNLWDDESLKARLDAVIDLPQIFFHALYNRLPPTSNIRQLPRTFIILPQSKSRTLDSFEAVDNVTASDEIDAHTTMFYTTSSSYYKLGLRAAELIVRCLDNEQRYGDQIQSQKEGDTEHGTRVKDDEEAPATEAVPPPSETEQQEAHA
jgi:pimeloyl-ACP methyl ester carboxylesterase